MWVAAVIAAFFFLVTAAVIVPILKRKVGQRIAQERCVIHTYIHY